MSPSTPDNAVDGVLKAVNRLRDFQGAPEQFWPALTEVFTRMAGARKGMTILPAKDNLEEWAQVFHWPSNDIAPVLKNRSPQVLELVRKASQEGRSIVEIPDPTQPGRIDSLLGIRLQTNRADFPAVIILQQENATPDWFEQAGMYVRLYADTPMIYLRLAASREANDGTNIFAESLDLLSTLNTQKKFISVALTLVNEAAARYEASRVTLGWVKGEYVRIQAVSNIEKFEKQLDLVRSLESTMEESFDQDEEVIWPTTEDAITVCRAHQTFARQQGTSHIMSFPIRVDGQVKGVLTFERTDDIPFTRRQVLSARLLCDQVSRRLDELYLKDLWMGARASFELKESTKHILGPEHTLIKLSAILASIAILFMLFFPWTYRVEAPFTVNTDFLVHVPAPFDGFLGEVPFRVGDTVKKNSLILRLDQRNLLIARDEAMADKAKSESQAAQAMAEGKMSEFEIAQAEGLQAKAKVDLAKLELSQSEIRAPFDGIIVEGDLQERIGGPIKKGEILFRIARLDAMYAQIRVKEADIHEIRPDGKGELAFSSRPSLHFPFEITRINPEAEVKADGNVFVIRSKFEQNPEKWWRPGMSGIAKLAVGIRTPFWILTHRSIDFLILKFWL